MILATGTKVSLNMSQEPPTHLIECLNTLEGEVVGDMTCDETGELLYYRVAYDLDDLEKIHSARFKDGKTKGNAAFKLGVKYPALYPGDERFSFIAFPNEITPIK